MTTTMDIVVCLDCSSSIMSYFNQIRSGIFSVLNNTLAFHPINIRVALIEFGCHVDHVTTQIHPFTTSRHTFQQWINAVQSQDGGSYESKAVVDALIASLALDWRSNKDTNRYHENLVILITDGPPSGLLNDECPREIQDLWTVSNDFEKQDITLAVVGVEPSVVVCDDFYCALANKTGGEYLPLINAPRVLSRVIRQAILKEDTLSQSFRHLNMKDDVELNSSYHYSYIRERACFMMEHCQTMSEIRTRMFTYRHPSARLIVNEINNNNDDYDIDDDDVFQPQNVNQLDNADFNIIASTPTTDDEGYRTRLPTVASANSSFVQSIGSPAADFGWASEIDADDDF